MKPPVFEYERPPNLRAALDALARHGGKAKLLAGGHSLIPQLNLRLVSPSRLIDVSRLTELQYIVEEYGQLRIGALTTHNTILRSPVVAAHCPIMTEAYPHVANHSIRNRGTLGGNLCHNDPAFEMPLVVTLARRDDGRPQRALDPHDRRRQILQGAVRDRSWRRRDAGRSPRSPLLRGHGYAFLEVSQRFGDRALIAAGCLLTIRYGTCRDVRIGFRNAVHNVFRSPAAEAKLEGKPRGGRRDRGGGGSGGRKSSGGRRPARRRGLSARRRRDPDPADAAHRLRARRPQRSTS